MLLDIWPKERDIPEFLNHAIWYCLYGGKNEIRDPDGADIWASAILRRLRAEVVDTQRGENV